ncbi:MAG: AMP-binding protein [Desulfocurvibacter africanus]
MFVTPPSLNIEYGSWTSMEAIRDDLIRRHVAYAAERSPFYRRLFAEHGIAPRDVRTAADLAMLPFTRKEDLAAHGPEFLCVERSKVVDLCLTSGTTSKPVVLMQTAADLDRLGYNEEISFRSTGLTENDTVLNAAAMDRCFMAGLAYFLGLVRLGATVIRAGSSSVPVVAELVRNYAPTAIVGVPTLLLAIAERLRQDGFDPAQSGVKRLVCIGEPLRLSDFTIAPLGKRLQDIWQARLYSTYASTELATAFCDCDVGQGGHAHPDLVHVEILDEEGKPVPPGQPGEVVVTPLQVEGMPLVRYRTGDIAALHDDPCPCGRNSPRLGPILGRKSQVLKYKGTTVYPPAIFSVLQEMRGVRGYYIEVTDRFQLSDNIKVVVGVEGDELTPRMVAEKIASSVRVKPEVVFDTPDNVANKIAQPGKRKPVTFFDLREGSSD